MNETISKHVQTDAFIPNHASTSFPWGGDLKYVSLIPPISRRDFFAAHAMTGLFLSNADHVPEERILTVIAASSRLMADVLIKELDRVND